MPTIGCVAAGAQNEVAVLTASSGTATSTTEAIISPQITIPANTCQIGTTFAFDFATSCAAGAVAQTTPGQVYQLRWGGLAGTLLLASGTLITPATALGAAGATGGRVWGGLTVITIGATGTVKAWLSVIDPRVVREVTSTLNYVKSSWSAAITVNTTIDNILCVTHKCTAADAANLTIGISGYTQMIRV
jgi:hypothetical protein